VRDVSEPSEDSVARLEDQLDGASRTLSALGALNARQAERVAARMDRLSSHLLDVSEPVPMAVVHEHLATAPASDDDFASLAREMRPGDSEG
jgi:hypothetical protein